MPKIWERSSRSCSGVFSSANADDKSSPNAHTVSRRLFILTVRLVIISFNFLLNSLRSYRLLIFVALDQPCMRLTNWRNRCDRNTRTRPAARWLAQSAGYAHANKSFFIFVSLVIGRVQRRGCLICCGRTCFGTAEQKPGKSPLAIDQLQVETLGSCRGRRSHGSRPCSCRSHVVH